MKKNLKKLSKPFPTRNWLGSCDNCCYSEPHFCALRGKAMKNMDIKRCRDFEPK